MKILPILFILAAVQSSSLAQPVWTNSAEPAAQVLMYTRAYRIDTDGFIAMRQITGETNSLSEAQVVWVFCRRKGIDLSPPASLFYSCGEKALIVRSTLNNLDKLEKFFADLKRAK